MKNTDIGEVIRDTLEQGISPALFFDMCIINGGQVVKGRMNWETMRFVSVNPVRSVSSYVGIYIDMNYVNTALTNKREFYKDRIQESGHYNSRQKIAERGESI